MNALEIKKNLNHYNQNPKDQKICSSPKGPHRHDVDNHPSLGSAREVIHRTCYAPISGNHKS